MLGDKYTLVRGDEEYVIKCTNELLSSGYELVGGASMSESFGVTRFCQTLIIRADTNYQTLNNIRAKIRGSEATV